MTKYQGPFNQPVDVYWNLHRSLFSVRSRETGRVIGHWGGIWVANADLVVQPAGRDRVRREGKKNVHAFIRGLLYDIKPTVLGADPSFEGHLPHHRISYNPYENDTFVSRVTGQPVTSASMVRAIAVGGRPMLWAAAHNYKEKVT